MQLLVKCLRITIAHALAGQFKPTGRIHPHTHSMALAEDKRDACSCGRPHPKTAVRLFEETLRALSQRLNHQASILIEHSVRSPILRKGIVHVGWNIIGR